MTFLYETQNYCKNINFWSMIKGRELEGVHCVELNSFTGAYYLY